VVRIDRADGFEQVDPDDQIAPAERDRGGGLAVTVAVARLSVVAGIE